MSDSLSSSSAPLESNGAASSSRSTILGVDEGDDRTQRDIGGEIVGAVSQVALSEPSLPVLLTGIPHLDMLLGGGLTKGSLAFIAGPPGSGKTTLAMQIAFSAARTGQRVLVFTALSESTLKLVTHLRTLSFFDPMLVGDSIQLISLQAFLDESLKEPEEEIVRLVRQTRASLVILDGFRGVEGIAGDRQAPRRFLYSLGSKLNLFGATTLITSETNPRDALFYPAATIADVIVGLHYTLKGVRHQRGIEIVKSRGMSLSPGLHALQVSTDGIHIFPRMETIIPLQIAQFSALQEPDGIQQELEALSEPPAAFALPALDDLMGGGLTRGTSTLLLGAPGAGKTLLGLSFAIAGVRNGEPAVFLGFRESLAQVLLKVQPFEMGDEVRQALQKGGMLTFLRWPPVELNPDVIADETLATLDRTGARRLVIDGLTELEDAIVDQGDIQRVKQFTAALLEALRARHVTSLIVKETGDLGDVAGVRVDLVNSASAVLSENMLLLRQEIYRGALRRVLGVLKMRFAAYDSSLREFTITAPRGFDVRPKSARKNGT